jgi:hypothetical protein
MPVHFLSSVPSLAFKASTLLASAWLLAACNAKVIDPIRLQAAPSAILERMANDPAPQTASYGVPDTSQVVFEPSAQTQTEDLTF